MATLRPLPSVDRASSDQCRPRRRPRRRILGPWSLLIAVAFLAAACAGEPPEVTNGDPELVTGRAIYAASCASCHGADGGGGVGTKLNDGATLARYPEIDDAVELVLDGKDRMPAFVGRLDEDQVRAVVRYTREVL